MLVYDDICVYAAQWNKINDVVYIPCTVILSAVVAHLCCSNDNQRLVKFLLTQCTKSSNLASCVKKKRYKHLKILRRLVYRT